MKKLALIFIAVFAISGLMLPVAFGSVVSTTGAINIIAPPGSVVGGAKQSDTVIWLFNENQNVTLGSNLIVDITSQGTYKYGSPPPLGGGTISSGTPMSSYFLHFDPSSNPPESTYISASGTVTFSQPILGIILLDATLDNTDGIFGTGTTYPGVVVARGIEFNWSSSPDIIDFLSSNTIGLNPAAATGNKFDQVRVLTAIPIPATLWIFGAGVIGLVGIRRKIRS